MKEPTKDLLDIDLNRLEDEARVQPQRMYVWGTKLAEARKRAKEEKNRAELIHATLDKQVRSDPATFGIEKITEAAVKAAILEQNDYQNVLDSRIQAEYEEDILDAFVKALASRDRQIETLAKLHGQMYWSKPDVDERPKVTQREREELSRKANRRLK